MPLLIKQFLNHFLSANTNWKALLLQNWPTIIGTLAQQVSLEKIYDDLLILGVQDSSWLQELYLLSPVILQTINANLDQPRIKQLRFKQVGRKKKKKECAPKPENSNKTVCLKKNEETALAAIEDEQLRNALKNFLIRCYRER